MRRVLEVFGEPISRGGQESYVMTALQHMDLSEIKVDLFTPYYCDNQEYVQYIENHDGKVITGNMPFKVGGTRREIIPVFKDFLKKEQYNVIHIHSGSISVLAYYAKVASQTGAGKVIVHSHSSGVKESVKHFLMKWYAAVLFKKYASDFCACSIEAARWKFPKSILPKVKILNNGVDLEKFRYRPDTRKVMRDYLNIDDNTLVLGHVGRFTYEKNQTYLLDVLKKYIELYSKQKVRLVLVGDGAELKNVKNKALELGINDKVFFVGSTDQVSEYMQAFDVFLFPSLYEGLGIVGVEAQVAGLPVIASTGIPEAMKVTESVIYIELNSVDEWCRKINELLIRVRKTDINAIRIKGFDINDTALQLYELYND